MKPFEVAVQIRNLEIELFWKRSIFFWGFIAAAFAGYAALRSASPNLAIVVACFGMVCSCAWSLLNRGSKFWQESWETKVERLELDVTGKLFGQEEPIQYHKGCWLRARKFSVSKLSIALSDYVFVLWLAVVVAEMLLKYCPASAGVLVYWGPAVFVAFSVIYLVILVIFGRKSPAP